MQREGLGHSLQHLCYSTNSGGLNVISLFPCWMKLKKHTWLLMEEEAGPVDEDGVYTLHRYFFCTSCAALREGRILAKHLNYKRGNLHLVSR